MRFSVAVPRSKKSLASSMLRKYRRLRRPGGLRREYKKLRSLLPGATRSHHLRKKVGVVEAAYQYICELQSALLDKFSTKGVPEDLAGVVRGKVATASDIQALALHLINNSPSVNNNNIFMRSNYSNSPSSIFPSSVVTSESQESVGSVNSTVMNKEPQPEPSPLMPEENSKSDETSTSQTLIDEVVPHSHIKLTSREVEDGALELASSFSPIQNSLRLSKDGLLFPSNSLSPSSPSSSSESPMSTEEP